MDDSTNPSSPGHLNIEMILALEIYHTIENAVPFKGVIVLHKRWSLPTQLEPNPIASAHARGAVRSSVLYIVQF